MEKAYASAPVLNRNDEPCGSEFCPIHHFKLAPKELRLTEVRYHMSALHVVPSITVIASCRAAYDQIHILDIIFYTNTHNAPDKSYGHPFAEMPTTLPLIIIQLLHRQRYMLQVNRTSPGCMHN